jgi:rhomboid family GlyGly-CTERM serine protease
MNVRLPVDRFKSLLTSLNGDGRYGIALLLISILLLLPELSGDASRSALRYDRTAIEAGQWWRFVTAHFVHLDLEHALLNVLGLTMMWALFARDYLPRQWLVIVVSIVLAIDVGLWFWDTRIHWYVGASGALHGFMAAGTLAHLRRGDLDGWILAIFIVLKLGYEQWGGSLPFTDSDVPVVVNAHLYGALGGAIPAAFLKPRHDSL